MTACNGHYLTRSAADTGFIVADSELGDFAIANLLSPRADLAWRGDTSGDLLIQLNLKQFELIDTLALCLHNMTAAATITVDFYDSRTNSPLLTINETIGGTYTIPAYKNKILSFAEVNAQEIDITISDPDNPDGYVQIRRLKMGVLTIPTVGFDFGYTFGFISGEQYRGGEITWRWVTEEGLNDVNEIIRDYGADPDKLARTRSGELLGFDDDILWIGHPVSTNDRTLEQHTALVALVSADIPFRPNAAQGVFTARIEEIFYEPTVEPGTAFITTWRTTGSAETITLPATGINSFIVDWGDDSAKELVTTSSPSHEYADAGNYKVSIEGICRKWYQHSAGNKYQIVELSQWGDVGFNELHGAFHGCTNLDVTATDKPDLSAITDLSAMFAYCLNSNQFNVSGWDVSSVLNFMDMFRHCTAATSFSVHNWDVSSGENFRSMFGSCVAATSFPVQNWDVSSGENFRSMFYDCTAATSFPVQNWDVSSGENFGSMFGSCVAATSFPVQNWDVSSGLSFYEMFSHCAVATYFPVQNWDVSSGEDFRSMFYFCRVGAGYPIEDWVISSATSMTYMFQYSDLGNTNYDDILIGWSAQIPLAANFNMHFGMAKYSAEAAATARAALVADGITITDGGAA